MSNTTTTNTTNLNLQPLAETATLTELSAFYAIPIISGLYAYTQSEDTGLLGLTFLINILATVIGFISAIPVLLPLTTLTLSGLILSKLL